MNVETESSSWERASPASRPRGRSRRAGATRSCSKRATGSAAGCSTTTSGRRGRRGRRPVDRSRAAPDQQARRRARARDVPDLRRGREPARPQRQGEALHGRDPAAAEGRARRPRAVAAPLRPAWPSGCRSKRRGPPTRRTLGRARRSRPGSVATRARASARFFWEVFAEAVFAAEPHDFSLLHALAYTHSGGGVNSLIGVRNAAQQDRVVGGTQLIAQRLADALAEPVAARCAGAPDRAGTRRCDGRRRRSRRAGAARDRVGPAGARGPYRLRAGAADAAATSSRRTCRPGRSSRSTSSTTSRSGGPTV